MVTHVTWRLEDNDVAEFVVPEPDPAANIIAVGTTMLFEGPVAPIRATGEGTAELVIETGGGAMLEVPVIAPVQ